jgi:hypothetical protein
MEIFLFIIAFFLGFVNRTPGKRRVISQKTFWKRQNRESALAKSDRVWYDKTDEKMNVAHGAGRKNP